MKVEILYLTDGAKQARGLTVVIDVFRAFSTACYTFGNGAKKIIPLGNIDTAYTLKKENPEVSWNLFKNIVNPLTKNDDDNDDIIFDNKDEEAENEILQEIVGDIEGDTIYLGDEDIDFDDI